MGQKSALQKLKHCQTWSSSEREPPCRPLYTGYEKTCTLNFGPVDWRHDPKIFGLESSTAMCMEHALESYLEHSSLADVLLGERWDARPVAAGNAFRVVLTMRVAVDEMQVCSIP